jgi:hypothetical protein
MFICAGEEMYRLVWVRKTVESRKGMGVGGE